MKADDLLKMFREHRKRAHLIGDISCGVIAGLDLEGRLYAVSDGEVLNRVNPAAVCGISGPAGYLNPGGDGLWPAPEGTRFGYQYATGSWCVPPGVTGARYAVAATTGQSATLHAEIELVNAQGLGIPVRFGRAVEVTPLVRGLTVTSVETFEYRGGRILDRATCLLAPWTLCQFDCGEGCETVFPDSGEGCVWDLYDPSDGMRTTADGLWHVRTDGSGARFQLGLGANVPWLEFRDPRRGLRVRRTATPLRPGMAYLDIADRPPAAEPDSRGVRFSIYSDPSGFMEIEAAGGMPAVLEPGTRMETSVTTEYHKED